VTPGVTHWATAVGADSSAPSPSATTTSATHGVGDTATPPAGLRSQGSVRRLRTICGSRSPNAPSALAGGYVDRIWSVGIAKRGAATVTCVDSGATPNGVPVCVLSSS
jgi:hypothetical protein